MKVFVSAPEDEIRAVLESEFTTEELDALSIEPVHPHSDPLDTDPRRAEPVTTGMLIWFASTIAGGVVYDLTKKAYNVLVEKLGHDRVHEDKGDE